MKLNMSGNALHISKKGNTHYVHIMNLPDNSLFIPFTSGKIRKATCLNDGSEVKFRQDKDGILLKLGKVPSEIDFIVELML